MDERDIRLSDGSLLTVKVNFLTLYMINKTNVERLSQQLDKEQKKEERDEEKILDLQMEIAKYLIYIILRSNGKKIDEEEAMLLIPADSDEIEKLLNDFKEKMEKLKKKEAMKM